MKEYKISYFRLNLVLLGYLLYNVIYFLLDYSGGYDSLLSGRYSFYLCQSLC